MDIREALSNYILDENARTAFDLATEFFKVNNLAASANYYLRSAELASDPLIKSEGLYHSAECYFLQGNRLLETELLVDYSLAHDIYYNEAWILKCKINLLCKDWIKLRNDSYKALQLIDDKTLKTLLSIALYKLGDQHALDELVTDELNKETIEGLLDLAGIDFKRYDKSQVNNLKFQFNNINLIEHNYSDNYEDMFILTLFNGAKGNYLEIGYSDYNKYNNTKLLEEFNWYGLTISESLGSYNQFNMVRRNKCIFSSDLGYNWKDLLNKYYLNNPIHYIDIKSDAISQRDLIDIIKSYKSYVINITKILCDPNYDFVEYSKVKLGNDVFLIHKDIVEYEFYDCESLKRLLFK